MHTDPASLDTATLTRCLRAAAGDERHRQVDFLRYLDPFDAREAWREAGYDSLWQYCLRELALREGAAGRRIGAMRVLRRFPRLEAPLRDGRLGLTTVVTLRPVLTDENLDALVARAAFRTDEETRELVAALQPREAPTEGIRKLTTPSEAGGAALAGAPLFAFPSAPMSGGEVPGAPQVVPAEPAPSPTPAPLRRAAEVEPVAADTWSMRVTIDRELKAELDALRALLSHKIPDGNLSAVLREAVHCAIEKHGKRKGAVKPVRARQGAEAASPGSRRGADTGARPPVPVAVRRAVWERDGGRCTYVSPDGHRCESRWQLELDHVDPAARGGPSTVENTRLRCKPHNRMHAEACFGREHMRRFRRDASAGVARGEATIGGDRVPPRAGTS